MSKKQKSLGGKIMIGLLYALTAVLLIIIAYLIVMKMTNSIPKFFGYSAVKIVSPSMEPEIKTGEYIIIKKAEPEEIVVGDIIIFYSSDESIRNQANTHRVIEIINGQDKISFVTKGDNNALADKTLAEGEKLIGRFVKVSPSLSIVGRVMGNQYIFLFVVVIPAGALLVLEILNVMKKSKQIKKEELIEEEVERLRKLDEDKDKEEKE